MDKNSTASTTPTNSSDAFINTLQNKLLAQSDVVSSQDTNIETAINNAISGVKSAGSANHAATASSFDREIGYAKNDQNTALTGATESQTGFGINVAALRNMTSTTDKHIGDLESRKQEALLAGDAATASKLSDLQLQALTFKQKAQQDAFTNLLGVANFSENKRQFDSNMTLEGNKFEEQRRQFGIGQTFQEKTQLSNIALTYGIPLKEGDTIDTVVARAAPFASAKQKLELEKTRSEINKNNAEASKVLSGEKSNLLDPNLIAILAQAGNVDSSVLGLIKDPGQAAATRLAIEKLNAPRDYSLEELKASAESFKKQGKSRAVVEAEIAKESKLKNKDLAYKVLDDVFGRTPAAPTASSAIQRGFLGASDKSFY